MEFTDTCSSVSNECISHDRLYSKAKNFDVASPKNILIDYPR